jgi:hypothetical protein
MKHQEFIQKLKTFPPNKPALFYCPINKTYYYVCFIKHLVQQQKYFYQYMKLNFILIPILLTTYHQSPIVT